MQASPVAVVDHGRDDQAQQHRAQRDPAQAGGAGTRACQALLLGAKASALLDGRVHASIEDVRYVAPPVMRHRLVTSFTAESDGVTADHIVEKLFGLARLGQAATTSATFGTDVFGAAG